MPKIYIAGREFIPRDSSKDSKVEHTVYIAGPMSGIKDYNFPAFFKAQRRWAKEGHLVFNPAAQPGESEITKLPDDQVQDMFPTLIRRDIALILQCSAIAVLPGWINSRGAKFEAHLACVLGLPIFRSNDTRCRFPIQNITFGVTT